MAIQTYAAATNLMKRVYGPGIRDQLNNETLLLGLLKRVGKEKWGGQGFYEALRTGRNRSTVPGYETSVLPTAMRQAFSNFIIACRQYHGQGGFTAFGAAATALSDAAFGSMVKTEVDGLIADAKKDFNIDFYGTELGVLGKVNGAPGGGGTTFVVDGAQNVNAWLQHGTRYLSVAQELSFVKEDDGLVRANNTTVTAITGTLTFTGSASATAADNDLIVRASALGAPGFAGTSVPSAFTGLEQLIDDLSTMPTAATAGGYDLDAIQGIDRNTAANTFARGNVLDLNNAALSETAIQNLVYRIEENSGMYPDVFLTHRSVQSAFQQLLVGDRRFVPQKFPGGFQADALVYNAGDKDIPIIVDRECPYDRLYALNLDALKMYMLKDIEMIEESGSILRQDAAGSDAWNFGFRMFGNLGSPQPNALGKMVRIGGADERYGVAGTGLVVSTF